MKKILGTTLVAMALASGVMADATTGGAFIKGGVYSTEADTDTNPSTIGYEVGFGGHGHFDKAGKFLFGGAVNYGYQEFYPTDDTYYEMTTYGGELHLGYTFIDALDVFGLAGYYGTSINYSSTAYGSGTVTGGGVRYGAGIDYTIWEHLSIGVKYTVTNYDLTAENGAELGSTKLTNIGGNIKLRF